MRWSKEGANNLAKVQYRKENKELSSTIERYTDGLIFTARMKEIVETLSAAKAPKKDGKGNWYVDVLRGHVALLDAATTASRKVFRDIVLEDCLCQGIVSTFSEFQCFMEKVLRSMGYKCVGKRCLCFRHPYRYVLI